jgi:hypothetical protein
MEIQRLNLLGGSKTIKLNDNGLPSSLKDVKLIRKANHAIDYMNELSQDASTTKKGFCKRHHISSNTLNAGLKHLNIDYNLNSYKNEGGKKKLKRSNGTKPNTSRPSKTKTDKGGASGTIGGPFRTIGDTLDTDESIQRLEQKYCK